MNGHGISYGGTTDHMVPEWATCGACEAARRQVEDYMGTIPASQSTVVRHPMAETYVPSQLNRRARRGVKALKKQIERAASKRHARRAA